MKAKTKKVKKAPSRLDKLEAVALENGNAVYSLSVRIEQLEAELAQAPSSDAAQWDGDLSKLSEDQLLNLGEKMAKIAAKVDVQPDVEYWREEAAKARAGYSEAAAHVTKLEVDLSLAKQKYEAEFGAMKHSYEYAQNQLDTFKKEDETRAQTIREIVRPLGFEFFAPMDAVRELAKAYFVLRDEAAQEQAEKDTYVKSRLDERVEANAEPDCSCIRWTQSSTPLTDSHPSDIVLYGTWSKGVAVGNRHCRECGGSGYRRKDVTYPLYDAVVQERKRRGMAVSPPPDAAPPLAREVTDYMSRMGVTVKCRSGGMVLLSDGTYMLDVNAPNRIMPRKEKPLRLLVEVVANKDQDHGTKCQEFGRVMLMVEQAPSRINPRDMECSPAMSTSILPEMPRLSQLLEIYIQEFLKVSGAATEAGTVKGIRAVLKACGLEPAE